MTLPPNNCENLLDGCRRGDRRAQEEFYRFYFPRLLPIALRYLRHREEAVTQLNYAMLRVFQSLEQYDEQSALDGWLATIVRRTVLNFIRNEGRAQRRFTPPDYTPPVVDHNAALEQLAVADILKLLTTLPDYLRLVFTMAALDGYSHAEIARELEITPAASRWRLAKARELLRGRYRATHEPKEHSL